MAGHDAIIRKLEGILGWFYECERVEVGGHAAISIHPYDTDQIEFLIIKTVNAEAISVLDIFEAGDAVLEKINKMTGAQAKKFKREIMAIFARHGQVPNIDPGVVVFCQHTFLAQGIRYQDVLDTLHAYLGLNAEVAVFFNSIAPGFDVGLVE